MKELWFRIDSWLAENAQHVWRSLQAGAPPEAIVRAEELMGITFPPDVKASYAIHNGQKPETPQGFIEGWQLLSLEAMVEVWEEWKQSLDSNEFADLTSDPWPEIQPVWFHPQWIPLTESREGEFHCLDLAPTAEGRVGQIISVWEDDAMRCVVAMSMQEWLEDFAEALEEWEYDVDPELGLLG